MVKIFSGDDTDFKGDQRLALTFAAPDVDFTGCTAEVEFLGQKRTFAQVTNGGRLVFAFSADETRGMKVGVWPVTIRLRDSSGRVRTVDNTQRIKVTKDVNEAYADVEQELAVSLLSGGVAMPEIPAELDVRADDNIGEFKRKYNSLLALFRSVSAVAVMLLFGVFSANAASVATAPLDSIPGTSNVVTGVDLSGLEPGNYATVSNRAMNALQSHQSLSPATNYTDAAILSISNALVSGEVSVWKSETTSIADYANYAANIVGDSESRSGTQVLAQLDAASRITTNDVENIAGTAVDQLINDLENGTLSASWADHAVYLDDGTYQMTIGDVLNEIANSTNRLAETITEVAEGVAAAATEGLIASETDPVWSADKGNYATVGALAAVSNESAVVTRLFMASNVIDEVTNYNSVARLPSRRLYQLNESNEYVKVWDEMAQHTNTLGKAQTYTDNATGTLAQAVAPKAWSRVTSGLGAEAPSNTTWISTPTTVLAGGMEYAKVVHANGAVWVLSGNGMMNFDPTTNAYLRITADDGTEVFSIEKTDAVTVGADAEGITVAGGVITIPVPVVSTEHPTMLFREQLNSGAWSDESTFTADTGGAVSWGGVSGDWVCTVTFNGLMPSSMFFKFQYLREGSTVVRHGAATDLGGGITINGTTYQLGTATINGHTVLTLTAAP